MSYSNPQTLTYGFGIIDFGTGADIDEKIRLPAGKQGDLKDVILQGTEVFTSGGAVKMGATAGGTDYANVGMGTLADGTVYQASANDGDIVSAALPADTDIHVQWTATGGTPTGQAYVWIVVDVW